MRARKIRQRELFDDSPLAARLVLQKEVREEVLQLLTQWLRAVSEATVQESRDEQDRR
ncbi:MAG: hypothetical protein IPI06_03045 [Gammaproteobacteria bacterium]|nr:hypothetical protein [Gammaproteobacteria bacterium]